MKYRLIKGSEFNYNVRENNAEVIIFTDEVAPKEKGVEFEDLSNDKDGSVVGWMEDDGVYKVSTQVEGQKVIFNEDCSEMFKSVHNCYAYGGREDEEPLKIDFSMVDTSNVINMSKMFYRRYCLKKIDLSNFNTSNVTDMSHMFQGCNNLINLDLSGFNTLNVTVMKGMFAWCGNLQQLDLSHFDTSNVTNMSEMFCGCNNIEQVNLSSFDTSNVIDMCGLFYGCEKLKKLDLHNFDTSKVEIMGGMFNGNRNLEELDLSAFDTSKVDTVIGMFKDCEKLKNLKTTDKQIKNIYEEWRTGLQSETHPNIDFKKLKMDNTKELDAKEFECLGEIYNDDDLPF